METAPSLMSHQLHLTEVFIPPVNPLWWMDGWMDSNVKTKVTTTKKDFRQLQLLFPGFCVWLSAVAITPVFLLYFDYWFGAPSAVCFPLHCCIVLQLSTSPASVVMKEFPLCEMFWNCWFNRSRQVHAQSRAAHFARWKVDLTTSRTAEQCCMWCIFYTVVYTVIFTAEQ